MDLTNHFKLNKIVLTPYYDGKRYYHYIIMASKNGRYWKKLVTKNNTNPAKKKGDTYIFNNADPVRFIRVEMTFNSANTAVHLIELQAFGTPTKALNNNNLGLNNFSNQSLYNNQALIVYPNPIVNNNPIVLNFDNTQDYKKASLEILDVTGNILQKKYFELNKGMNTKILKPTHLPKHYNSVIVKMGTTTMKKTIVNP